MSRTRKPLEVIPVIEESSTKRMLEKVASDEPSQKRANTEAVNASAPEQENIQDLKQELQRLKNEMIQKDRTIRLLESRIDAIRTHSVDAPLMGPY